MQEIKSFQATGFYIFQSAASANSNYIENIDEAKTLLKYLHYYLKGYLQIIDYAITKDGFQMAVHIHQEHQIRQSHLKDCSSKRNRPVWKIISNRMRLCLSTYVRVVNYQRGRKGVLVRERYKKFYFETKEEALDHLNLMRQQSVRLAQPRKKYRGIKKHYKIHGNEVIGSVFLCSKNAPSKLKNWSKSQQKWFLPDLVVLNWVKNTLKLQQLNFYNKNCSYNTQKPPD